MAVDFLPLSLSANLTVIKYFLLRLRKHHRCERARVPGCSCSGKGAFYGEGKPSQVRLCSASFQSASNSSNPGGFRL